MHIPGRWLLLSALILLPLSAYCPELNPVEGFGRPLKAPTVNRLYRKLRRLENHLITIREGVDQARENPFAHARLDGGSGKSWRSVLKFNS